MLCEPGSYVSVRLSEMLLGDKIMYILGQIQGYVYQVTEWKVELNSAGPWKRKKAVKEIYWYRLWVPRT